MVSQYMDTKSLEDRLTARIHRFGSLWQRGNDITPREAALKQQIFIKILRMIYLDLPSHRTDIYHHKLKRLILRRPRSSRQQPLRSSTQTLDTPTTGSS